MPQLKTVHFRAMLRHFGKGTSYRKPHIGSRTRVFVYGYQKWLKRADAYRFTLSGRYFCLFGLFIDTLNVESKGMRVNMNKTKVMISGERQMVWQKAARWPCGVCTLQ